MTVYRVLPLVAMLLTVPFATGAQFGQLPGVPGGGPPAAQAAVCQRLMALRDETQKRALAIQTANELKASQEVCRLFKAFQAAAQFIKEAEEYGLTCGAPPDFLKQVNDALQIGMDVCGLREPSPDHLFPPGRRRK